MGQDEEDFGFLGRIFAYYTEYVSFDFGSFWLMPYGIADKIVCNILATGLLMISSFRFASILTTPCGEGCLLAKQTTVQQSKAKREIFYL